MKKILSIIIIMLVLFQSISVYADIIGVGYDIVTGKIENGSEVLYPTGDRYYEPVCLKYGYTDKFSLAAEDTMANKIIWGVGDENIIEITETSPPQSIIIKAVVVGHTSLYAYKMSYAVATGEYSLIGMCSIPIDVIDSGTWDIVIQPTETEKGIAVKTLDSGKQILEEISPLSDTSVWTNVQTVKSTCTESGYAIYSSKYGDVKEIIPNTGHEWKKISETELSNGEIDLCYKCSLCRLTKNEKKYNYLYYLRSDSTIGIYGFNNGSNLSGEITFPATIDGYEVKEVSLDSSRTEYDLSNVTGIIFENGIEKINTPFAELGNLEYVLLPDTLKCIDSYTFKNCTKLQNVEIPHNVTSIGEQAFAGCNHLNSVIISEGVEKIDSYAFSECPITRLSLPNSIKNLANGSFKGSKITEILLPEGLKTFSMGAFSNVEYYYIPSSVTKLNDLYALNSSCKGIYVSNNNSAYSSDEYGVLYNKNQTELLVYPTELDEAIYNLPDGVKMIGPIAFGNYEQKYLQTISFTETLVNVSNSAFFNCKSLCRVVYDGSKQNYLKINIELGNDVLSGVEVVCKKTGSNTYESLSDLNVEFSKTSSRWHFDISDDTYEENAIIYVGIYDENNILLTAKSESMVRNDITSISITKINNSKFAKVYEWVNMKPVANVKTIDLN